MSGHASAPCAIPSGAAAASPAARDPALGADPAAPAVGASGGVLSASPCKLDDPRVSDASDRGADASADTSADAGRGTTDGAGSPILTAATAAAAAPASAPASASAAASAAAHDWAGAITEDLTDAQLDHAIAVAGFQVGFSEDRNKKYRRTMEDSSAFFYNYAHAEGSGWFAVFDGHAGKAAAEHCGQHLHDTFARLLVPNRTAAAPRPVPELLNAAFVETDQQLKQKTGLFSGCTAAVAFIQRELRPATDAQRVLYTANVGDARVVLCRGGHAVRLSYDHKGSDPDEARRIMVAGGYMLNNRVNGMLAVTRSLGDISMKDYVIGNPYTTETVLQPNDAFLILACDGVWDVCSDQEAVDLIADVDDPDAAADRLLDQALARYTTDNLSVIVVRFRDTALATGSASR